MALISALVLALLAPGVSASAFLQARTQDELQAAQESIQSSFEAEFTMDSVRLSKFEDQLLSLFNSLPKNEHGALESPAVRYALHRYFVHTHGWYVIGLEPLGQAWNSTSPANAVKGVVPSYIQGLFDQRLQGRGLGLRELAVFAAILLDHAHNAVVAAVVDMYSALHLDTTTHVAEEEAARVVQGFALQILDGDQIVNQSSDIDDMEQNMVEWFPHYGDFKSWIEDTRRTISFERRNTRLAFNDYTLDSVIHDVQELNDRLFAFQDIECRHLKAGLMDLQHGNSGRVLVADYYAAGLQGEFLFVEHIDYLRKLGALDESDANHPSVIIANILTGKGNCLTETGFHSVCCLDECQGLFTHLERSIAAPMATPNRIAELISWLPSDTVTAPRNLSTTLMARLGEIAEHHSGYIPLHGRLFAQWMHHAYPLECAYPHVADTTSPMTQDEWMARTGADDVTASAEDRQRYIKLHKPLPFEDAELPWTQLEELVGHHKIGRASAAGSGTLRKVAAFAAVMAVALSIARVSSRFFAPGETKVEKFMV